MTEKATFKHATEAVVQRCFVKKVKENTSVRVSFLIKLLENFATFLRTILL